MPPGPAATRPEERASDTVLRRRVTAGLDVEVPFAGRTLTVRLPQHGIVQLLSSLSLIFLGIRQVDNFPCRREPFHEDGASGQGQPGNRELPAGSRDPPSERQSGPHAQTVKASEQAPQKAVTNPVTHAAEHFEGPVLGVKKVSEPPDREDGNCDQCRLHVIALCHIIQALWSTSGPPAQERTPGRDAVPHHQLSPGIQFHEATVRANALPRSISP